jgi:uncharacterized membrane protein (UPF0127 family)
MIRPVVLPKLYVDGRCTKLRVCMARTFGERIFGMLRSRRWQRFEVLCLPRCTAVHTCFVPLPIDIVFTDRTGRVLQVVASLAPWRVALMPKADSVWELPEGVAQRHSIEQGVRLQAWLSW